MSGDQLKMRLNNKRRKNKDTAKVNGDPRSSYNKDYDRILFSTPVRRLADKTQVFPMEMNESIRNRLTHSHEVSNIAESLARSILEEGLFNSLGENKIYIPTIARSSGLAHDLGNPPFGHSGERAISNWFKEKIRQKLITNLSLQQQCDLENFEGNAQTFRLLTKLQLLNDGYGLDLTYATLASLMKYTVPSHEIKKKKKGGVCCEDKYGFFANDEIVALEILNEVGLSKKKRHFIAYLMEASDDIAYSILDIEDAVKKKIFSFGDLLLAFEENEQLKEDAIANEVFKLTREKFKAYSCLKDSEQLNLTELNDVVMQRFRVFAMTSMITAVREEFKTNLKIYLEGEATIGLLDNSKANPLNTFLKGFARKNAYNHRSVTELELNGASAMSALLNIFWAAIRDREDKNQPATTETLVGAYSQYVFSHISENYKRIYLQEFKDIKNPDYSDSRLLCDMVSGMTDKYVFHLFDKLKSHKYENHKG